MPAGLSPQKIDEHNWYYEYPTHMLVVHEVRDRTGQHVRTDSIKVYWRKIEKSLARVRAPKRKRRSRTGSPK